MQHQSCLLTLHHCFVVSITLSSVILSFYFGGKFLRLLLRTCGSHLDLALLCPVQAQQHSSVWPATGTSPSLQVGSEMCSGVPRGFGSTGAVLEQCGCDAGAVPKWCWPCQAEDQQREHKSAKIPPGSWGERRAQAALVCTGPLLCPVCGKSLLPGSAGTVGPTGTAPSSSSDAAGSLGHISGQIFCPPEIPARSSASHCSKQTQSCARCWGGGRAAGAPRAVHRSFQHR